MDKPLSYQSLLSVFPLLSFEKKMKLSVSNKLVRGIQKRNTKKQPIQSITLKCAYAENPHEINYYRFFKSVPNANTVFGTLTVENIDWTFYFNASTRSYTVYCSLKPEKPFEIRGKDLILKYFHYFTSNVASYVQFVDVQSAMCPFSGIDRENAKIRSIKLKILESGHYVFAVFGWAEFEKIELYNADIDTTGFLFNDIRMSKHIVAHIEPLPNISPHLEDNKVNWMFHTYENVIKLEVHCAMVHPKSFITSCRLLIRFNYTNDSFISAKFFNKNRNFHVEMWKLLIENFPEAELSHFQNRKCLILKENSDFSFLVFREESSNSDDFTITKIAK